MALPMFKATRNTVFTIAAVGLTAFGLSWNNDIQQSRRPLSAERAVLAAKSLADEAEPVFPLEVTFDKPIVKLGQYQELTIKTVPDAELDIVTLYPNGSVNNNQTLKTQADSQGRYQIQFKLSDFYFLGLFQTTVIARTGNKTAEATGRFILQTWVDTGKSVPSNDYVYPLVP